MTPTLFESTSTEAVSAKTLSADSGGIMGGGGGGGGSVPTPVYTVIPGTSSSAASSAAGTPITGIGATTPTASSGQAKTISTPPSNHYHR